MPLLDDVGNWLVTQGIVGGSTGWTLGESFMPPNPDKMIVLYETPGENPEIIGTGSSEKIYDKPGFQVRIRSTEFDYVGARSKIQEVFKALHQKEPAITSGVNYVYVYGVSSGPMPMGLDANNRPELTWNFRTMKERF